MEEVLEKLVGTKPHIHDARIWAESLNKMKPNEAMEKLEEVKRHWVKLREKDLQAIQIL